MRFLCDRITVSTSQISFFIFSLFLFIEVNLRVARSMHSMFAHSKVGAKVLQDHNNQIEATGTREAQRENAQL